MKLHLRTFFSHLIFHPFDADRKKDQRIALISSIAIGILFLGIGHGVCALLKNRIKPKETKKEDKVPTPITTPTTPKVSSPSATPTSGSASPKRAETKPKAPPTSEGSDPPVPSKNKDLEVRPVKKKEELQPIQVEIDKAMKDKLDPLIPGGVDSLPIYQQVVSLFDKFPDPKLITAPVMKGVFSKEQVALQNTGGKPFIIIKMYCELNERNSEILKGRYLLSSDNKLFSNRKCDGYLILFQTVDSKGRAHWHPWPSLDIEPHFFKISVTEHDSWSHLESFFQAGKAEDKDGILWQRQDPENSS